METIQSTFLSYNPNLIAHHSQSYCCSVTPRVPPYYDKVSDQPCISISPRPKNSDGSGLKYRSMENHYIFGILWTSAFTWLGHTDGKH